MKRVLVLGLLVTVSIFAEGIWREVGLIEGAGAVIKYAYVRICPDNIDSVPAGRTICYLLEVLNFGDEPDVIDITFTSTQPGWYHRLVSKDGINDLSDTDGDGIPDAGSIPGAVGGVPGVDTIYLDVTPPYSALPGASDTTVVRATSSIDTSVYDSAILVTIVCGTSVEEEPGKEAILGLYLDRAVGTLYLSLGDLCGDDASFELFDASGRRVLDKIISNSQTSIDVSYLPQGVYFVSVQMQERERLICKVVVY